MELIRLEESARAQHKSLCKTAQALRRHAARSSRVRNNQLQTLGVVKSAPLEVDERAPFDFERRFFSPSYKDEHLTHALGADDPQFVAGIVETGRENEQVWGETFSPRRPNDDDEEDEEEWLPPYPEQLPAHRFVWFATCIDGMLQTHMDQWEWWEDEEEQRQHESRTDGWRCASGLETGDSTFYMPQHDEVDRDYRPLWMTQPRDPARPHFGVVMGDSDVPGSGDDDEDEMLVSELHAAAEFSKRQLTCGDFTNHHTKPIIIYTLMSETHARITQAHFDAKADKLVIRQSRLLDLRGKRPTPDAYLLLRWMMNVPVGETAYKQEDAGHDDVMIGGGSSHQEEGRVPSQQRMQPSLVVAEAG
ncbi:hypothetical protein DHEL01_v208693 [Diaporthe helianthi]|uniref:Uncharacterized protein n=1 Tax=Diaporthe helianthi TaxID=158607 RepID=A0A2P5HRM1_DIAHE|nr:hypothetical protein DHEL01_v208693 [Diaporthe helianthi]